MQDVAAVVLAAGQGTRMKSKLLKVLHVLNDRPMIDYVIRAAEGAALGKTVVVIGFQGEKVQALLGDRVEYAWQREQLGTGHAVMAAASQLGGVRDVLVLYGDTPLITAELISTVVARHRETGAAATVVTLEPPDPTGYGRIVRDENGRVAAIVEDVDLTGNQRDIRESNSGICCFRADLLLETLPTLGTANVQGEYYLVDVVNILLERGRVVEGWPCPDNRSVLGINDRKDLALAANVLRQRTLDRLMEDGVTVVDPLSTFVGDGVVVGRDTIIHPFTFVQGETTIGAGCVLGPGSHLVNCRVGDRASVFRSVVTDSTIGEGVVVGPFAHVRPGCELADGSRVGNFAELKNTRLGPGSKLPHHSYVGDASVGAGVNLGAGVVTVNYDGLQKHRTEIADEAFVGCNVNLIAPVRVERGAYVAAGSTINRDVPPETLAVARARQENKEGWIARRMPGMVAKRAQKPEGEASGEKSE